MDILLNPITVSVVAMCILCLLRVNVLLSLIIAALIAGLMSGLSSVEAIKFLVGGMGGQAETALSYVLLGVFAASLAHVGIADKLSLKISKLVNGRGFILLIMFIAVAICSQTLIPVHIAFIPILVPPLLYGMNQMKLDRRGAACALAFGLKAPYITLPFGFGLIFQGIIAKQMTENGMAVETMEVWKSTWILGLGMLVGLMLALLVYKRKREYQDIQIAGTIEKSQEEKEGKGLDKKDIIAIIAILATMIVQLITESMPLGAIAGIGIMILFGAVKIKKLDGVVGDGIKLMGLIAFVMLVASGYGNLIRETGAVENLVEAAVAVLGGSKAIAAIVMILIGLITTMGIGTSFGTVPILAVLYVPMALQLGFSPAATIVMIAAAAALGDAGSPASDTTLGPTSGLNADGQHNHIWDTCVPTFVFYNIPLIIFGFIGAMIF